MSSTLPIAFVEIRAFMHATEDEEKVLTALHCLIPVELVEKVVFKKISQAGHYGNPITILEARIKEKSIIQAVLERLANGLSILEKEQLSSEMVQHLDKGKFYLRLDKQSAFLGVVRLGLSDPIHLKIQFKKSDLETIVNVFKRFGMFP